MSKNKYLERNRKVAKARGERWKKALRRAKFDLANNLTVIKEARFKKGFSQQELFPKLGLYSKPTYSRIETGRVCVKLERAEKIAKALGVSLNKAFKKQGERFKAI